MPSIVEMELAPIPAAADILITLTHTAGSNVNRLSVTLLGLGNVIRLSLTLMGAILSGYYICT